MIKCASIIMSLVVKKTGLRGFRPGLTQTGLCSYRRRQEAWNFAFRKKRDCTICVAKTNALVSCAVTAQLICAIVFAYAKSGFLMRRLLCFKAKLIYQNLMIDVMLLTMKQTII